MHKRAREKGLGFQRGPPRQTQLSAHLSIPHTPSSGFQEHSCNPLWPRLRCPELKSQFRDSKKPVFLLGDWRDGVTYFSPF